jgi:hypothetical protein
LIVQAKKEGKIVVGAQKQNAGMVEVVDLTLPDPAAFVVRGTVRNKDGSHAKGITVIAYDFDPKDSKPSKELITAGQDYYTVTITDFDPKNFKLLGETISNEQGCYAIEYNADQLVNPLSKSPYLIVHAKIEGIVVAGATKQNAGMVEVIDLTLLDVTGPDTNVPVTTRVVFGFVKYLGGNVVRSGVDVILLERYNGIFFDIGSAKSSRANGSFRIEYTSNKLQNPNMPDLFIQVLNYGTPIKIEGALSEGPIDLIYAP